MIAFRSQFLALTLFTLTTSWLENLSAAHWRLGSLRLSLG
jgi:hypothetical protein